jgi:hypothetical protein
MWAGRRLHHATIDPTMMPGGKPQALISSRWNTGVPVKENNQIPNTKSQTNHKKFKSKKE